MHHVKFTGGVPGQKIKTVKAIRIASKLYAEGGQALGLKEAKYAADDADAGIPTVLYGGDESTARAWIRGDRSPSAFGQTAFLRWHSCITFGLPAAFLWMPLSRSSSR